MSSESSSKPDSTASKREDKVEPPTSSSTSERLVADEVTLREWALPGFKRYVVSHRFAPDRDYTVSYKIGERYVFLGSYRAAIIKIAFMTLKDPDILGNIQSLFKLDEDDCEDSQVTTKQAKMIYKDVISCIIPELEKEDEKKEDDSKSYRKLATKIANSTKWDELEWDKPCENYKEELKVRSNIAGDDSNKQKKVKAWFERNEKHYNTSVAKIPSGERYRRQSGFEHTPAYEQDLKVVHKRRTRLFLCGVATGMAILPLGVGMVYGGTALATSFALSARLSVPAALPYAYLLYEDVKEDIKRAARAAAEDFCRRRVNGDLVSVESSAALSSVGSSFIDEDDIQTNG